MIRYALGKSLADINRGKRMESRYDGEARPKYELIGKVHWFIHSVKDYLAESPHDVLFWHKGGYLSLHYKSRLAVGLPMAKDKKMSVVPDALVKNKMAEFFLPLHQNFSQNTGIAHFLGFSRFARWYNFSRIMELI